MAALTKVTVTLVLTLVIARTGAADPDEPVSLSESERFILRPFGTDILDWWRPTKVVDPNGQVAQIAKSISELPPGTLLGDRAQSSLLIPAAVQAGESGRAVLAQVLAEYQSDKPLDDRWVLSVAGLGRIPSPESGSILRAELRRVVRSYDLIKTSADRPVLDALLACEAGRGALTADMLDELGGISPVTGRHWTWWMGLAWANALMPREAVVDLIVDGLGECTDTELEARLEMRSTEGRETGIRSFLMGPPREVWPVLDELLVRSADLDPLRGDWVRSMYLGTVVLYRTVLAPDADYQPPDELLSVLMVPPTKHWRGYGSTCAMLHACRDGIAPRTEWEHFIDKYASIDPQETEIAKAMVAHLLSDKGKVRAIVERRPSSVVTDGTTPGVYLMGFRAIRNLRARSPASTVLSEEEPCRGGTVSMAEVTKQVQEALLALCPEDKQPNTGRVRETLNKHENLWKSVVAVKDDDTVCRTAGESLVQALKALAFAYPEPWRRPPHAVPTRFVKEVIRRGWTAPQPLAPGPGDSLLPALDALMAAEAEKHAGGKDEGEPTEGASWGKAIKEVQTLRYGVLLGRAPLEASDDQVRNAVRRVVTDLLDRGDGRETPASHALRRRAAARGVLLLLLPDRVGEDMYKSLVGSTQAKNDDLVPREGQDNRR